MSPLARISETLIPEDLARFRVELDRGMEPQNAYLTDVERQMISGGKKVRPIVLLLSAHLVCREPDLPEKAVKGAAALEMLHVATLIHDDIVDDAGTRRGHPSVSGARGTKTALLIGDLQFVQALRSFVDAVQVENDMTLVKLVLDTAFEICCGELDELDLNVPEDRDERIARYYKTIDRKTAVLFELAAQAGVDLGGGRTHEARRAGFFGRALGRAFQIMDDILDVVETEASSGKPQGADLKQGCLSLPVIYAMEELGEDHAIARAARGEIKLEGREHDRALTDLRASRAIDRAYSAARRAALEAVFYLKPFRPSAYRNALEELTMYIVDRPLGGASGA